MIKRIFFPLWLLIPFILKAHAPDSLELKHYSLPLLKQDFDLTIRSLKEAHTGLYWYNSQDAFDRYVRKKRGQLHDGMNGLEFYQLLAPIIAYTKEGHTNIRLSKVLQQYLQQRVCYLPVFIKILNGKIYLLNDLPMARSRGSELLSVNGVKAGTLLQRFMTFEPSDGYNVTGKYRWIEENAKFNLYYARCFPATKAFTISFKDAGGKILTLSKLPGLPLDSLRKQYTAALNSIPNSVFTLPAKLAIDSTSATAVLTINSFQKRRYTAANMDFHTFVKDAFYCIKKQRVSKLIIDIRKNGGGTEGYEDYLLSFMIRNDYLKYSYVQASAFHYSFYPFSDYRSDWMGLDSALRAEHYKSRGGRILRKPGVEEHEKPQADPYTGAIIVLTSGLTYSGGSEFASLMRNHTNATFIGEETAGGYYGNTSGYRITLQLPNTGLEVAIPILKFVVNTPKHGNPFGRGVLPDIAIQPTIQQYLQGIDPEMLRAQKL
ncbi:S41 family peptidase [Mucilaginibacter lutimaris]|uniref:S41 family peptidase n=1 Tax=Mucilaginibacter lutimaris TaxID=931629 RepID=A0ABW2ZMS6_9SPHI